MGGPDRTLSTVPPDLLQIFARILTRSPGEGTAKGLVLSIALPIMVAPTIPSPLVSASSVGLETLPDDLTVDNVRRHHPPRVKQFVDQRLNEDILQDILYDAFVFKIFPGDPIELKILLLDRFFERGIIFEFQTRIIF